MNLDLIATNYGVDPTGVQIKAFLSEDMVVLAGNMIVWTSPAAYKGVHTLEITCAQLPMVKSLPTTVMVVADVSNERYATVTRAWIKDGNTICIKPVREYDEFQYYYLKFFTAFVAPNKAFTPQIPAAESLNLTYTEGSMDGVECLMVREQGWIMLLLKADTINFSIHTDYLRAQIPNWPQGLIGSAYVLYNEDLHREKGSRFYNLEISNTGLMAIAKDNNHTETEDAGPKFIKAFFPL